MQRVGNFLANWRQREDGNATVEFAIVFPAMIGMLLAGIVIADTPLRRLFMRRRHYVPVLLRLIICPIITVLLLRVIGAARWIPDGHSILLTVYLACITPACATVTSMAQLYDRDAEYSSALYVLTTLFSILTMPLMVWVFEVLI